MSNKSKVRSASKARIPFDNHSPTRLMRRSLWEQARLGFHKPVTISIAIKLGETICA